MKHFGFDLDNTLVDYSKSCATYCIKNGIPIMHTIGELRSYLKPEKVDTENWTMAQAWLYTEGIEFATISDGAIEFIDELSDNGWKLSIHSHKTQNIPLKFGGTPLRINFINWFNNSPLEQHFQIGNNLFFYDSLIEKLEGISNSNLSHYVDDLPKVFESSSYPRRLKSFLFRNKAEDLDWVTQIDNFTEIEYL